MLDEKGSVQRDASRIGMFGGFVSHAFKPRGEGYAGVASLPTSLDQLCRQRASVRVPGERQEPNRFLRACRNLQILAPVHAVAYSLDRVRQAKKLSLFRGDRLTRRLLSLPRSGQRFLNSPRRTEGFLPLLLDLVTVANRAHVLLKTGLTGQYHVGEVQGNYRYAAGQVLPHRRPVKWLPLTIARAAMSEALRNSTGSIGTVSTITEHHQEIEQFLAALPGQAVPNIVAADPVVEDPVAFAMEKHLEDFLVKNWAQTELAQNFKIYEEDGELVGQQYATDAGPIDILAVSKDGQRLLVVELKRGRASDVVVGQILRYVGYVKEQIAEPHQTVEGAIIALDDDQKLRWALQMAPSISFYRYQVSFKLIKH